MGVRLKFAKNMIDSFFDGSTLELLILMYGNKHHTHVHKFKYINQWTSEEIIHFHERHATHDPVVHDSLQRLMVLRTLCPTLCVHFFRDDV